MKASELLRFIEENKIDANEDFEVVCEHELQIFNIKFTFWHEGKLHLAIEARKEP